MNRLLYALILVLFIGACAHGEKAVVSQGLSGIKTVYLWDADGKEYIDCAGGQGAANLGHANPAVAKAIAEQAQVLISCPEMFYNDQRARLEQKLCGLAGMGRVFLCNSGTEAVEAAVKFARLLSGRTEVLAFMRGFHGRTMGALSATWEKKYREPFEPLVPGFSHVPYNNIEALEAAVTAETAAVILEAVQGEGGVYPADPAYLQAARRICTGQGALLILDEVQAGLGRTGKLFAYMHEGVTPDVLIVGKALAGGFYPVSAVLASKEILGVYKPGDHGSTFGGNPLGCAVARTALRVLLEEKMVERSAELGAYFLDKLKTLRSPDLKEVRGRGLWIGIELNSKARPYCEALKQEGILCKETHDHVIRIAPPLVITKAEIDWAFERIKKVVER